MEPIHLWYVSDTSLLSFVAVQQQLVNYRIIQVCFMGFLVSDVWPAFFFIFFSFLFICWKLPCPRHMVELRRMACFGFVWRWGKISLYTYGFNSTKLLFKKLQPAFIPIAGCQAYWCNIILHTYQWCQQPRFKVYIAFAYTIISVLALAWMLNECKCHIFFSVQQNCFLKERNAKDSTYICMMITVSSLIVW